MDDITIPDAAVEAAARADYYNIAASPDDAAEAWETYIDREWWLKNSRIALLAAAPHIAVQVASDIHGQFGVNVSDEMSDWWDGYRQAQRDVLRKLREIEAYYRIEAEHG